MYWNWVYSLAIGFVGAILFLLVDKYQPDGPMAHMPPNYYFDQIDWLTAYQRGKEWDWVELRPQTLAASHQGRQ